MWLLSALRPLPTSSNSSICERKTHLELLKRRNSVRQFGPNFVLEKLVVHLQIIGVWLLHLKPNSGQVISWDVRMQMRRLRLPPQVTFL